MPTYSGRDVTFTPTGSGVPVLGMTAKSITINNEPIDTTNDDDLGYQSFHHKAAKRGVSMNASGVVKDDSLIALSLSAETSLISGYTLDMPGIGAVTGDFHFGNLTIDANVDGVMEFSADINSSGVFEYVPVTTA